jgi:hypothetical protein
MLGIVTLVAQKCGRRCTQRPKKSGRECMIQVIAPCTTDSVDERLITVETAATKTVKDSPAINLFGFT